MHPTATFKCVVLAGVHDIKNLKSRIRSEEERNVNSPWNISAAFDVDLSFQSGDISTMLVEYEEDHCTGMNIAAVSRRIFYYTNGYPYLVSYLCKMVHDKKLEWSLSGIDEAEKIMVKEKNTLFDDIIKNLSNNVSFENTVKQLLLYGEDMVFNANNPDIELGSLYGIFRESYGKVRVTNIVFETLILDYYISLSETRSIVSR
jgi:hypothetical protein